MLCHVISCYVMEMSCHARHVRSCQVHFLDTDVWQGTDVATKLLLQVQCTAHHITDPNKRRIGLVCMFQLRISIIPVAPTCVYHFVNGHIVMTAINDVGEELTYSYIDLYQVWPCHCRSVVTG